MEKRSRSGFYFFAILFYVLFAVMLYKGYDKMTHYENSEHSWGEHVNAYVGGDAYNYIINGNYATGFFVLSIGFLISGTLCVGIGVLAEAPQDDLNEIRHALQSGLKQSIIAEEAREAAEKQTRVEAERKAQLEAEEAKRRDEEARKARIDAFWVAHASERQRLLDKKAEAERALAAENRLPAEQKLALQKLVAAIDAELTKDRV